MKLSFDALIWAKNQTGLVPHEKLLLMMIADRYSDEQKRAWPGRQELSVQTGMSVRTISKHIGGLEQKGLITVERWFNNNTGKNLSNRYYLPKFDTKSGHKPQPNKPVFAEPFHDPITGRMTFVGDA